MGVLEYVALFVIICILVVGILFKFKDRKPLLDKDFDKDKLAKFSKEVRKRDGKCMVCGTTKRLEAHHILNKRAFPAFAYEVGNGITLCKNCHRVKFYSYHGLLGAYSEPVRFFLWYYITKLVFLFIKLVPVLLLLVFIKVAGDNNLHNVNIFLIIVLLVLISTIYLINSYKD